MHLAFLLHYCGDHNEWDGGPVNHHRAAVEAASESTAVLLK